MGYVRKVTLLDTFFHFIHTNSLIVPNKLNPSTKQKENKTTKYLL